VEHGPHGAADTSGEQVSGESSAAEHDGGEHCDAAAEQGDVEAVVSEREKSAAAVDDLLAAAGNNTQSGEDSDNSSDSGNDADDDLPTVPPSAAACPRTSSDAVRVALDLFHAMRRVIKRLSKKHGAYRPFIARLRDAFTLHRPADVNAAVTAYAAKHALSGTELDKAVQHNFASITRHCPVTVPGDPEVLRYRFDQVIIAFSDVKDAATGWLVQVEL
jgi:hypothetical protein